jgi:PKD repeat protein
MPTGPSQESDVPPQRSERPANHRLRRRRLIAAVGAAGLGLICAQVVLAVPPDADFSAPSVLQIGQEGTFEATASDPDGGSITSIEWDFDNDGDFDDASGLSVQRSFDSPGTKIVRMLATDSALESTPVSHNVRVNVVPSASFTISPNPALLGQTVTFNGSGSSDDTSIVEYQWDLDGNGSLETSSANTNVSRSYASPGEREIKLRVKDADGVFSEITTRNLNVNNGNPVASFTSSPTPGQIGEPVSFNGNGSHDTDPSGSIVAWEWDWENNGSFDATGATAQHTFDTAGQTNVALRVTDNTGARDTVVNPVRINAPPVASFTVSPNPQVTGQPVAFNGNGSSDPDGTIAAYAWDTDNDGAFDNGGGSTVSRTFGSAGTFTVGLRVTDNNNATHATTRQVVIHNAPTASITALGTSTVTPAVPDVGETVNFDGSASSDTGGSIVGYEWDLDGNTANGFEVDTGAISSASRSYDTRGSKTARLRVTDNQGGTAVAGVTFRVNALPVARVFFVGAGVPPGTIPTPLPLVGEQISFTSLSTDAESLGTPPNPPLTYTWVDAGPELNGLFGSDAVNVTHDAYATAGDKRVVLRVTDTDGATADELVTVRVNTPPVANFGLNPQTPITNETITFDEAATDPDPFTSDALPNAGALVKVEWDLDGNTSNGTDGFEKTGEQVTASYPTAGAKTVRMRVTDGGGATHVVTKTVQVENTRPTARWGFAPQFPVPGQEATFASSSTPTAGKSIETLEWDFDFDPAADTFAAGDVDATGPIAAKVFSTPGPKTIALKVTETGGGFDVEFLTVIVNAPPVASFAAAPNAPVTDDDVTFASTSVDPDGPISHAWDTDNDGEFDDGNGSVAARKFAAVGSYTVWLRVSDDRGASSISKGVVNVARRPAPAVLASRVSLIASTVQIAGRTTKRGAKLSLLRVRLPVGAVIKVKCKGSKACPYKSKRIKAKRTKVRLKLFERSLPAGTKIVITTTLDGFIGKHVVFKIRKNKAPKRTDRCLQPGETRPTACPGA